MRSRSTTTANLHSAQALSSISRRDFELMQSKTRSLSSHSKSSDGKLCSYRGEEWPLNSLLYNVFFLLIMTSFLAIVLRPKML